MIEYACIRCKAMIETNCVNNTITKCGSKKNHVIINNTKIMGKIIKHYAQWH